MMKSKKADATIFYLLVLGTIFQLGVLVATYIADNHFSMLSLFWISILAILTVVQFKAWKKC
jgi:hypothetical protein